jgi:outer membrane lipoprotein LolB
VKIETFALRHEFPRRFRFILAALLIGGCAALPQRAPVENPDATWQTRQSQLARLDVWDLRGRVALRTDEQGAHASLRWVRDRERHRMNLAGPFGGGRVRLTYDRGSAELRDADGGIFRGATMQQLLLRATGWNLPIEGLNYWVLGLPDPGAPAQSTLDEWGRLKLLEQLGWSVEFLEYTQAGEHELPKVVFIRHKPRDKSDAEIEVRLAIETWEVRNISAKELTPSSELAAKTAGWAAR